MARAVIRIGGDTATYNPESRSWESENKEMAEALTMWISPICFGPASPDPTYAVVQNALRDFAGAELVVAPDPDPVASNEPPGTIY